MIGYLLFMRTSCDELMLAHRLLHKPWGCNVLVLG
jgi:hypothetical protein